MLASRRTAAVASTSRASPVPHRLVAVSRRTPVATRVQTSEKEGKTEAEQTTLKFGLEAGLVKALTSKDEDGVSKTDQAKQLLAQYGSAYLITSISFAIVSFAACWAAVEAGLDVAGLLAQVGLQATDTTEKVGTFAIAYAAHKALSPVRFPPTVALTPVVAKWIGKKKEDGGSSGSTPADN